MSTGSSSSNVVLSVEPGRFLSGIRLVPTLPDGPIIVRPTGPVPRTPDIVVDVLRSVDLVAFTLEGYDVELVTGEDPVLRPTASNDAIIVIQFSFQHMAERAIFESPAGATPVKVPDPNNPGGPPIDDVDFDPPGATHVPPIEARPAKPSQLVFRLHQGDEIEFSTQGILDAMGRLEMVVHSLATPPAAIKPVLTPGPVFEVPGGFSATLSEQGLIVSAGTSAVQGRSTSLTLGEQISASARDSRRLRSILSTRAGIATGTITTPAGGGPPVGLGGTDLSVSPLVPGGGLIVPDRPIRVRRRKRLSRPPEQLETAIEAPYRLIISPSTRGGWAHAEEPVGAEDAEHRVELWHSRLGVRREADGDVEVDERASRQRIVRAVWARDRERFPNWDDPADQPAHDHEPFRQSLDSADRHMLVRQTSETWLGQGNTTILPEPVDATALYLSSLGAWLDLHGTWDSTPYSEVGLESILLWDHIAPMGRDQFVRVMYPGYLYPFGHKTTLVKVTERKMKDAAPSVAGMFQRLFMVVGEPLKTFSRRDLPFEEVRLAPLVTPSLDDPGAANLNQFFFPSVGGADFPFVMHTVDREGTPIQLTTPLLWVAESFGSNATNRAAVDTAYSSSPNSTVQAGGQKIAYAPVKKGGDTVSPTQSLKLGGAASNTSSTPTMETASIELPAIQQLSPIGDVEIQYSPTYLTSGFGGAANSGEVWAELTGPAADLAFGGGGSGSDKAGGFLQPNMAIEGLSRISGTVGDVAGAATQSFDPNDFLSSLNLPKLFGVVELADIITAITGDLDRAPSIVSEALERIEAFIADLERAKKLVEDAVAEANKLIARATNKAAEVQAKAQQALTDAEAVRDAVVAAVDDILAQIAALPGAAEAAVEAALADPLQALSDATALMEQVAPQLPPLIREQLTKLAAILRTVADAIDIINDIYRFLEGLGSSATLVTFRFEWKPPMASWPNGSEPVLELQDDSLVLAVEGRVSGKGEMGVEVLAELRDFSLHLPPNFTLVRFRFDHLTFKAGSTGKAEVDVVIQETEFVGLLSFVEVLKELIPFDGFSDPPFVEVDTSGLTAGFSLDLPNVAIGVFNLSNMSLGADIQVPFLGESVTVGFNFCTRERPFVLTVMAIGGGGWFMMRLAPDGLDVLELGLEAGASLAVDFGVASGSISAMIGIYIRLEGDEGSLTGYFRLRGEVDVLGLISASIELYLELVYEFSTGKMIGSARLTVKVEVLFFSASVTIECERRFAGSNGDPNFIDLMGLEPDGTSPAWSEYCLAFAGA